MAQFLSTKPGMTSGPTGRQHSIMLQDYLIFDATRSNKKNLKKSILYLHEKHLQSSYESKIAIQSEINRARYFNVTRHDTTRPKRLFKMMKGEHADKLCNEGTIGLGPLSYFTRAENKSIADPNEGYFITLAEGRAKTVLSVSGVGSHVLVFCTTADQNASFCGYDACVEITDADRFLQVVSRGLSTLFSGANNLIASEASNCVYQHSRVIAGPLHGFSEALVELGELSKDTVDVLDNKKYLIKETKFANDAEFRFAFVMEMDVKEYQVLSFPDLTALTRRIR